MAAGCRLLRSCDHQGSRDWDFACYHSEFNFYAVPASGARVHRIPHAWGDAVGNVAHAGGCHGHEGQRCCVQLYAYSGPMESDGLAHFILFILFIQEATTKSQLLQH